MIGTGFRAPCSVSGRRPPSAVSKRAPNCASGVVTRPMGRRDSEASPTQRAVSGVVAIRPMASRTPVPELPKSSAAAGDVRPATPTPWTRQAPSEPRAAAAPSAVMARAVLITSSASSRPRITVSPMATAPNIRARWDMDLSPGTRMRPVRPEARAERSGRGAELCMGAPLHDCRRACHQPFSLAFDIADEKWHAAPNHHIQAVERINRGQG